MWMWMVGCGTDCYVAFFGLALATTVCGKQCGPFDYIFFPIASVMDLRVVLHLEMLSRSGALRHLRVVGMDAYLPC